MITVTLPFESIEEAHAALGTLMVQQVVAPKADERQLTLEPMRSSQAASDAMEATEPPVKKKRGRPRKIKTLTIEEVASLKKEFEDYSKATSFVKAKQLLNEFKTAEGTECRKFSDLSSAQHVDFRTLLKERS